MKFPIKKNIKSVLLVSVAWHL